MNDKRACSVFGTVEPQRNLLEQWRCSHVSFGNMMSMTGKCTRCIPVALTANVKCDSGERALLWAR